MILSLLWIAMAAVSLITSVLQGTAAEVGAAALTGAQDGIRLALSIAGALCLWSGFARLTEKSGLADRFCRILRPAVGKIFPETSKNSNAFAYLCENLTANLLGLGNAATPMGIRAVRAMADPLHPGTATDEMCLLVVMNTASLQLIPSTVAAVRAGCGASHPFDILPAVWLSSLLSVSAGILTAKAFAKRNRP